MDEGKYCGGACTEGCECATSEYTGKNDEGGCCGSCNCGNEPADA